jgi:hypothetical protein
MEQLYQESFSDSDTDEVEGCPTSPTTPPLSVATYIPPYKTGRYPIRIEPSYYVYWISPNSGQHHYLNASNIHTGKPCCYTHCNPTTPRGFCNLEDAKKWIQAIGKGDVRKEYYISTSKAPDVQYKSTYNLGRTSWIVEPEVIDLTGLPLDLNEPEEEVVRKLELYNVKHEPEEVGNIRLNEKKHH